MIYGPSLCVICSLNGEDQNALPNLGTFELPNYTARQPHRAPLPKARLDQYMKPFLEVPMRRPQACTTHCDPCTSLELLLIPYISIHLSR